VRARHLEVVLDGQPRVPDALLVRFIQRQVLVPVAVDDAPDDVNVLLLDVAVLQVAFVSKVLKPGSHFIGSRVETRRFQATGLLDSTCTRLIHSQSSFSFHAISDSRIIL
jgi:hypothetical protein